MSLDGSEATVARLLSYFVFFVTPIPKLGGRPTGGDEAPEAEMVLTLHWPPFPYHSYFSERPTAVKGAPLLRGGGKSFLVLKRFSGAHP
jgi:hypothetical protein